MNEGLQRLIDHLETLDNGPTSEMGFDMSMPASRSKSTRHECGSACCVGGHAALLLGDKQLTPEAAFKLLCGTDGAAALSICYPPGGLTLANGEYASPYNATPMQAAKLLRYFAKTDQVDWLLAMDVTR